MSATRAPTGCARARCEQITRDHSLLQEQIDAGLITVEQAAFSSHKNLVTRAVGVDPEVQLEVHGHDVRAGDLYLLCSDGLTDMVELPQIEQTAARRSARSNASLRR